jgi:hypothetical protein
MFASTLGFAGAGAECSELIVVEWLHKVLIWPILFDTSAHSHNLTVKK